MSVGRFTAMLLCLSLSAAPALAQDEDEDLPESERQQRVAAAKAYDQGSQAFMAESFQDAARWFETAFRFRPSAPALRQAIRAHESAGNIPRAATLARKLKNDFGDEKDNLELAEEVLAAHGKKLARIVVHCEQCSLLIDERETDLDFYITPDEPADLVVEFDTGKRERTVKGKGGQRLDLHLAAPPPPTPEPEEPGSEEVDPEQGEVEPAGGLPPIVVLVGAGLTVIAGGVTVWSAIDMNSGVDAYEQALDQASESNSLEDLERARQLLEDGDATEMRTNVLIGVTAGLAAVTGVLAVLTDWSGSDDNPEAVAVVPGVSPRGEPALAISGRF